MRAVLSILALMTLAGCAGAPDYPGVDYYSGTRPGDPFYGVVGLGDEPVPDPLTVD